MMYAKIVDNNLIKHPYYIEEMRSEYPDLIIDDEPTDEQLAECNAKRAVMGTMPTKSSRTHTFSKAFVENEDGTVTINILEHPLPQQVAEFNMRDARDGALTRSDWVVTRAYESGQPVPPEYIEYRQKLRDLTNQEGFPYDIVWPDLPQL